MRLTVYKWSNSAAEAAIIIDWCNETFGAENWFLISDELGTFMFYREEDATMFRLKWSCIE